MSTMQNAMQAAMAEVNKKLEQGKKMARVETVWRALKETGRNGMTLAQLRRRLSGLAGANLSVALADLGKRGMVSSRQIRNPDPMPRGALASRQFVNCYVAEGERYELLPLPAAEKARKAKYNAKNYRSRTAGNVQKTAAPAAAPEPAPRLVPVQPPGPDIDEWIESLTIAQARIILQKLEKLFHEKK
jgi:hypothetical protein